MPNENVLLVSFQHDPEVKKLLGRHIAVRSGTGLGQKVGVVSRRGQMLCDVDINIADHESERLIAT